MSSGRENCYYNEGRLLTEFEMSFAMCTKPIVGKWDTERYLCEAQDAKTIATLRKKVEEVPNEHQRIMDTPFGQMINPMWAAVDKTKQAIMKLFEVK